MTKEIYKNEEVLPEGFPEAVSMDDVEEGTTYGKVKSENISNGSIKASGVDGLGLLAELNMVTVNELLDGCVTELKIAASAVTNSKIAVDAIQGAVIAAGAITESKIYTGAVTTDKIYANAVTAAKIAANTITASQIAANTITATQIAAGTITATQIAASTITSDKINVSTLSAISANIGTVTAGSITGVTITGGTVQTGTSGQRIVMTGNTFSAYDTIGADPRFQISNGVVYFSSGSQIASYSSQIYMTAIGLYIHSSMQFGEAEIRMVDDNIQLTGIIYAISGAIVASNTYGITLGGVNRTTWPTSGVTDHGSLTGVTANQHHSSTSASLAITPASYTGGAITCNSGSIDQTDTGGRVRQYLGGFRARTAPGTPASGECYVYFDSATSKLYAKIGTAVYLLAG